MSAVNFDDNYPFMSSNHATHYKLDILNYPTLPIAQVHLDTLRHDDSYLHWLERPPEYIDGKLPISGLHLLYGRCTDEIDKWVFHTIPFPNSALRRIFDAFKIPKSFEDLVPDASAQCARRAIRGADGNYSHLNFTFKTGIHFTGFLTYAITYEVESGITKALLLTQTSAAFHIHHLIMSEAAQAGHPMLLPVVVGRMVSSVYQRKLASSDKRLDTIEEKTGMHTFDWRPKGDPLSINMQTTRSLNSCSTTLGVLEMRLNGLLQLFDRVAEYHKQIYGTAKEDQKRNLARDWVVLEEEIENLSVLAKSLLLRVSCNQKRAASQLAVVYNFTQQRDNMLNIQVAADSRSIAQASKHDSSAMKTISVLGMVFLPGTFVATLLSMPLLQWQSGRLMTSGFWIYWAITIPLTLVVLVVWGVWIRWSQYRRRKEEEAVRSDGGAKKDAELGSGTGVSDFFQPKGIPGKKKSRELQEKVTVVRV